MSYSIDFHRSARQELGERALRSPVLRTTPCRRGDGIPCRVADQSPAMVACEFAIVLSMVMKRVR